MPKLIGLTKGYSVLVDDEDFETLSKLKWYADVKPDGRVYAIRRVRIGKRKGNKRKTIRMHRLISNAPNNMFVDHINNDPLDNRRCNLRLATAAQNSYNHYGQKSQRKYSNYKGVKKNVGCSTWSARITIDGNSEYIGCFQTEKEAALAYNERASLYFKEFAKLNEVESA